jgi:hypothetical protein
MLVNISPTVTSGHETYCSLKFANQVNQVQLGVAKKNITIMTKTITAPSSAPPTLASSVPPQNLSPTPGRSRPAPLLTQTSSSTITTSLVPSQSILTSSGNKSHLALAPAARVQHIPTQPLVQPAHSPPPLITSSQSFSESVSSSFSGPNGMTLTKQFSLPIRERQNNKRQSVYPPSVPSSTIPGPSSAAVLPVPKRARSVKTSSWR